MPDAISSAYNTTGDDPVYFPLGPVPPNSFLLSLYGIARAGAAAPLNLSHSLTLQDAADAAAHAAGRRLLARSTTLYNTQPGYVVGLLATATVSWSIPLNAMVPGGAAWIITYAQIAAGLTTWNVILTVTWLHAAEYERIYGLYRPVSIVGAPPPPPAAPPGPPVAPDFIPT